jgi:hypothetical protein
MRIACSRPLILFTPPSTSFFGCLSTRRTIIIGLKSSANLFHNFRESIFHLSLHSVIFPCKGKMSNLFLNRSVLEQPSTIFRHFVSAVSILFQSPVFNVHILLPYKSNGTVAHAEQRCKWKVSELNVVKYYIPNIISDVIKSKISWEITLACIVIIIHSLYPSACYILSRIYWLDTGHGLVIGFTGLLFITRNYK